MGPLPGSPLPGWYPVPLEVMSTSRAGPLSRMKASLLDEVAYPELGPRVIIYVISFSVFFCYYRYLMAWKASKTKLVKSKYLISAIIFGAMVPYLTIFGNTMIHQHSKASF